MSLAEAAGIETRALDLTAPDAASALPQAIDAVIASQAARGSDAQSYRAAYVEVTATLLELARRRPGRRLVYVSSTGVFGQTDGSDCDESTPVAPASETARVLVEAEQQVIAAAQDAGVEACIVRLSGLYGPGRYGVVERVRSGRLALGPDDHRWMNWCHRADATTFVRRALESGRPGAVYHGSDATPVPRREVVAWIASRLGIPPPRADETQSGRRAHRRILSETTRTELAVSLAFPCFRDGLAGAFGDR